MDPAAQQPPQSVPPPPPGYGPVSVVPPPPPGYGAPTVATATTPAAPPPPDLTAQPDPSKPQGVYRMLKGGKIFGIPYGNVQQAQESGYGFDWSGKEGAGGEGERYGNDVQADPNREQDSAEQYGRAFVGTLRSHVGGALQLLGKLQSHMSSPDEVVNYKKDNPGATTEQAMTAIEGKDLNSQITGPYKSQHRRDEEAELQKTVEWFKNNNQQEGVGGWLGAASENIAELMAPSELMKLGEVPAVAGDVVSAADKMQSGAKVANFLKNSPVINRLVGLGLRALRTGAEAGALSGGQTYVDTGGDADQAAQAAALGAAGGTVLHTAAEGAPMAARALLARLARPSITADAVGDAARAALANRVTATNATRTAPTNALPASTGEFQFRIGGTPTAESTIGLRAGGALEDADEGAPLLVDARKKQTGTRVLAGKGPTNGAAAHNPNLSDYGITDTTGAPPAASDGSDPNAPGSHRSPQFQYLDTPRPGTLQPRVETNTGGGTLTTSDPKLAAAHLSSLRDAMVDPSFSELPPEQQQLIQAQHDDMQQQLADYYKHQKVTGTYAPNFQPVAAKAVIDKTGNFEEAANHLHDTAVEVYDHANSVTGGQWQALDKHIGDLQEQLGSEPYPAGRAAIRQQIAQAQDTMTSILEDPRNGFDATDVAQAKANFRAKYVLQDAHQAVKPLYGIEEQTGLTTGQYRGFNGNMVGQRWKEFLKANPDARQIIGADRVDTLQRMFDANGTMAARRRFGNAIASVGMALGGYALHGPGGAIGAETAYQGIRYALRGMVANPKVAKNLLAAIDSARPEQYAPHIARIIRNTVPAAAGGTVRALNDSPQQQEDTPPAPKEPEPVKPRQLFMAVPNAGGLVRPGNINILDRPIVPNEAEGKGQSSTVFSTGIEQDGQHILIPRVSDGADGKPPHIMTPREAIQYYQHTGQHLGIFNSDAAADAYGRGALHEQQATLKNKNGRTSE